HRRPLDPRRTRPRPPDADDGARMTARRLPAEGRSTAPRRSAASRYSIRFTIGLLAYTAGILGAGFLVRSDAAGPTAWWASLLTLPGIAIMVWALMTYYRECDELARRKLG